jgi:hypothetical protein
MLTKLIQRTGSIAEESVEYEHEHEHEVKSSFILKIIKGT